MANYHPHRTFSWKTYLRKQNFVAAPVSSFKHVVMSSVWDELFQDVYVEVRNPDCKVPNCYHDEPCSYWLAKIVKTAGYFAELSYVGRDPKDPQYFNVRNKWVHLAFDHVHHYGWCAANGKRREPPKNLAPKMHSWSAYISDILRGQISIPNNLDIMKIESFSNVIFPGMNLEVVDKNQFSVIRPARVEEVVGNRLRLKFKYTDVIKDDEKEFWCHERSKLLHPVGWAQVMSHSLQSPIKYARKSLKKAINHRLKHYDCGWDLFDKGFSPVPGKLFLQNMKLEAIDPLNLSAICVASVKKVLRGNYLMIGIDGVGDKEGDDHFCCHATSTNIFPVGFCKKNGLHLTPPPSYGSDFNWTDYLKDQRAIAAPLHLFSKPVPDHGFKAGMFLEAVDLLDTRLICPGVITQVVGRLIKIHFDGWEDDFDQWLDCESPDIFPIGWCETVGWTLEPPKVDSISKRKKTPFRKPGGFGQRKRRHKRLVSRQIAKTDAKSLMETSSYAYESGVHAEDADNESDMEVSVIEEIEDESKVKPSAIQVATTGKRSVGRPKRSACGQMVFANAKSLTNPSGTSSYADDKLSEIQARKPGNRRVGRPKKSASRKVSKDDAESLMDQSSETPSYASESMDHADNESSAEVNVIEQMIEDQDEGKDLYGPSEVQAAETDAISSGQNLEFLQGQVTGVVKHKLRSRYGQ